MSVWTEGGPTKNDFPTLSTFFKYHDCRTGRINKLGGLNYGSHGLLDFQGQSSFFLKKGSDKLGDIQMGSKLGYLDTFVKLSDLQVLGHSEPVNKSSDELLGQRKLIVSTAGQSQAIIIVR